MQKDTEETKRFQKVWATCTDDKFTMVPNALVEAVKVGVLDGYDKAVLACLLFHSNVELKECWPSYATIGAEIGFGETRVKESVAKMKKQGLFSTIPIRDKKWPHQLRLHYHLTQLPSALAKIILEAKSAQPAPKITVSLTDPYAECRPAEELSQMIDKCLKAGVPEAVLRDSYEALKHRKLDAEELIRNVPQAAFDSRREQHVQK